ncbi:MAG: hypothetical protein M9929_12805 [Burkholderiaceae bacterium]|nr:hypothetical protein [Burkholderiaceae bacterium]
MAHPRSARTNKSTWRAVRMPHQDIARTLHQRYHLRLHGLCIGSFTLLLMWASAHLQMRLGVESLALRYLATLTVGYLGYLLVLRVWAARLLRRRTAQDSGFDVDLPDIDWPSGSPSGGGDFAGGLGRSADGGALGDVAGGTLEAVGSADEGAIVVVPIVAIFLIGSAVLLGAGSLAMAFFGWDALLAVAVELAFSVATARAAMGVEREGWLSAAVRLTWKPLLGALLCAVLLGAAIDHFLPQVDSLPEAVRLLRHK